MRGAVLIAAFLSLLPAAQAETALEAVKLLPPAQAARIARIEGREGTPDPDRWYILTQDPAADNGVHEYVVSNGKIVASRSISQFADSLKPDDILGGLPLLDSDKAAKLAHDYAAANSATVTSISYELKKAGPELPAIWTISCLDDKGNKVGVLVLTTGKGIVVSHDGFALEPAPAATPPLTAPPPEVPTPTPIPRPRVSEAAQYRTFATPEEPAIDSPPTEYLDYSGYHRRRPSPTPKKPSEIDKVGQTLKKILPF